MTTATVTFIQKRVKETEKVTMIKKQEKDTERVTMILIGRKRDRKSNGE